MYFFKPRTSCLKLKLEPRISELGKLKLDYTLIVSVQKLHSNLKIVEVFFINVCNLDNSPYKCYISSMSSSENWNGSYKL